MTLSPATKLPTPATLIVASPGAAAAASVVLLRRKLVWTITWRPAVPFRYAIRGIADITWPKSATTLPSASAVTVLGLSVSYSSWLIAGSRWLNVSRRSARGCGCGAIAYAGCQLASSKPTASQPGCSARAS